MTGLDTVMMLLEPDKATINANAVGLPPTASARLIASGTMTIVEPTLPITTANIIVNSEIAASMAHGGSPSGKWSSALPATQAAAPVESTAQPSGIRDAIRKTVRQLMDA